MGQSHLVWNPAGKMLPDRWKWVSRRVAEEAYKLHFKVVDCSLDPIPLSREQTMKPEVPHKSELLYHPESDCVLRETDADTIIKCLEQGCVVVTGDDYYEDWWLNEQLGIDDPVPAKPD